VGYSCGALLEEDRTVVVVVVVVEVVGYEG
jgi:hypothetical protein